MKAGIGIALVGVLIAIAAPPLATGAGADLAAKRASCDLTLEQARSLGASYVNPPIKTRGVRCGKAKRVIKAFHECRKDRGGANGRCKSRVKRYKCEEGDREGVKGVVYTAKVVCKKGSKRIKHSYTQNL